MGTQARGCGLRHGSVTAEVLVTEVVAGGYTAEPVHARMRDGAVYTTTGTFEAGSGVPAPRSA